MRERPVVCWSGDQTDQVVVPDPVGALPGVGRVVHGGRVDAERVPVDGDAVDHGARGGDEPGVALVVRSVQVHVVAGVAGDLTGDRTGRARPTVARAEARPLPDVQGRVRGPQLPGRRAAVAGRAVARDGDVQDAVVVGTARAAARAVVDAVAVVVGVDVVVLVVAVLPLHHPVVLLVVADAVVAPPVLVVVAAAAEEDVAVLLVVAREREDVIVVVVAVALLLGPAVAVVVVEVAPADRSLAVHLAVAVVVDAVGVVVGRAGVDVGVGVAAVRPLHDPVVLLAGRDVVVAVAVTVVILAARRGVVLVLLVEAGAGEHVGVPVVAVDGVAALVLLEHAVPVVVVRTAVVGAAVQVAAILAVAVGVDAVAVGRLGGARVDVRPPVVAVVAARGHADVTVLVLVGAGDRLVAGPGVAERVARAVGTADLLLRSHRVGTARHERDEHVHQAHLCVLREPC